MHTTSEQEAARLFPMLTLPLWGLAFLSVPIICELIGMTGIAGLSAFSFFGIYPFVLVTIFFGSIWFLVSIASAAVSTEWKDNLIAALFPSLAIVCAIAGMCAAVKIRDYEASLVIQRALPIITAIEKYESKHQTAPEHLEQLVPEYISEIPKVSFAAFGPYTMESGDQFVPWKLQVDVSTFSLSPFDREYMYYSPYFNTIQGERKTFAPNDWTRQCELW